MGAPRHRVLLVREWDAQTTGASCCGQLGAANHAFGDHETFRHNRDEMEAMGAVYRALRADLPRDLVDVQVVDPRNLTWLVPTIWRDARRHGADRRAALRAVTCGVSYTAIVVDGEVVARGRVPDPDEAVGLVLRRLGRAEARIRGRTG